MNFVDISFTNFSECKKNGLGQKLYNVNRQLICNISSSGPFLPPNLSGQFVYSHEIHIYNFFLRLTRKVLIIFKNVTDEKRHWIVFYILIPSQEHQNPIFCFISIKFSWIYFSYIIFLNIYNLSIILYFNNFVNGFRYKTYIYTLIYILRPFYIHNVFGDDEFFSSYSQNKI